MVNDPIRWQCRSGTRYHVDFQLDSADPEVFWAVQQQLVSQERPKGMLHISDASARVPMGAISYIHLETRDTSLLVQACHTFPDDCAIVKSQSKFELPDSTGATFADRQARRASGS